MEIRKGSEITPARLRSMVTKIFQLINEVDPSIMSLTTGQIISRDRSETKESDPLSMYGDQYFKTDRILNQYDKDVSYLQRYIKELESLDDGE